MLGGFGREQDVRVVAAAVAGGLSVLATVCGVCGAVVAGGVAAVDVGVAGADEVAAPDEPVES